MILSDGISEGRYLFVHTDYIAVVTIRHRVILPKCETTPPSAFGRLG